MTRAMTVVAAWEYIKVGIGVEAMNSRSLEGISWDTVPGARAVNERHDMWRSKRKGIDIPNTESLEFIIVPVTEYVIIQFSSYRDGALESDLPSSSKRICQT